MNLKELTWPLRLYWDLPHDSSHSLDDVQICEEIIKSRVLYLSLHESASPLSSSCLAILNKLKDENIAVSLTIASSALTPSMLTLLHDIKIKTLLINIFSFKEACLSVEKIKAYNKTTLLPGIAFDIGGDNFRDIPYVVSMCLNEGIPELVFPINRHCFFMNEEEREELRFKLGEIDFDRIRLTIHDPFLWKVFYPDVDYHEGGCQAANSMLFISSEYKVYPCPALPLELGDLHEKTLREIILSGGKRELRTSLLNPPGECAACDQSAKCLGGCRGRAFEFYGSFDRRDPACKD